MDIVSAWYQKRAWLWLLAPLSLLYRIIIALRQRAFTWGLFNIWHGPVPVIVVGNITVGGTGKTPLVIALAEKLLAAGYRPGIVSRGYGAKPPFTPFPVTPDQDTAACGDEPLLLAHRTGLPVVIDPDRPLACRYLIERCGCDVIISDDGLQHYRMGRDIEIAVLDSQRGIGNGRVLPMGPLREPVSRLASVDAVVVNGADSAPGVAGYASTTMSIRPCALVALGAGTEIAADQWQGENRVHAVAGIGNPQRFFDTLAGLGFNPIEHVFPDHHRFSGADLEFGDELPVIMTEKDAVKCRSLTCRSLTCRSFASGERYWYLKVSAELAPAFFDTILQHLQRAARDCGLRTG